MTKAAKRRLRALAYVVSGGAALFLFLATVPVVPYHPVCGGYYENRTVLKGPLRPIYQTWLEKIMTESGFNYWKLGDQIFIRYINIFDGPDILDREDLHDNIEWGLILSMAQGYTATQSDMPPPPPLLDAIRATDHIYGPFDPDSSTGSFRRFEDCEVKRAGTIWVEKLDAAGQP